jgi:hypothetical protein
MLAAMLFRICYLPVCSLVSYIMGKMYIVFESMVLRRPKEKEMRGNCTQLHNELYNLYNSPNTDRTFILRACSMQRAEKY